MKWDERVKEYDSRANYAMGQYMGVGQPPKTGKMKSSFMDAIPQKSHTQVTPPGKAVQPVKKSG